MLEDLPRSWKTEFSGMSLAAIRKRSLQTSTGKNSLPGFCFSAVAGWQDSFILTMIWEVLDHRETKKPNPFFMWLASELCRAVTDIPSAVKEDIYRHAISSRGCGTATAFPKLIGFCLSLVTLWLKQSTKNRKKSIYKLSVQLDEFLKNECLKHPVLRWRSSVLLMP